MAREFRFGICTNQNMPWARQWSDVRHLIPRDKRACLRFREAVELIDRMFREDTCS